MDDKQSPQKPLRFKKEDDIMKTYKKNEEKVIPISDNEEVENLANDNPQEQTQQSNEKYEDMEAIKSFLSGMPDLFGDSKEVENLTKERDELKEQLVRKAAELENQRKRHLREKQEMLDYANQKLLFKMLELLDDINAAVDSGNNSNDYDALLKGLTMIRQKAHKLFEEAGVKAMPDATGEEFDVNFHEAMMTVPSDLPEGCVVQTFQQGYLLNDKVLRHARVMTSSGK